MKATISIKISDDNSVQVKADNDVSTLGYLTAISALARFIREECNSPKIDKQISLATSREFSYAYVK